MTSIALQYGVPLKTLVDKFSHTRFEPAGFTNNRRIPVAKSVMDYVFRYLGNRFLQGESQVVDEQEAEAASVGLLPSSGSGSGAASDSAPRAVVAGGSGALAPSDSDATSNQADAVTCPDCGTIMVRGGTCYQCENCGLNSGCG
jgi:ribonucleoside-diphosphate reductase alpha chain